MKVKLFPGVAISAAGSTLNSKELMTQPHWQLLSKRLKNLHWYKVQHAQSHQLSTGKRGSSASYQFTVSTIDLCPICNLLLTILVHQRIVRPTDQSKIQRIGTVMSPREVKEGNYLSEGTGVPSHDKGQRSQHSHSSWSVSNSREKTAATHTLGCELC